MLTHSQCGRISIKRSQESGNIGHVHDAEKAVWPDKNTLTLSGVEQVLSGGEVEGTSAKHEDADSWVLVGQS